MTTASVPATRPRSILIVGASAAGVATADALRRLGHEGTITLIDGEFGAPYDRPPLSKQYLAGDIGRDDLSLRPSAQWSALDVELRQGVWASALHPAEGRVVDQRGRAHEADAIVLATGVSPRTLPGGGMPGAHTLRTVADADRLRLALGSAGGRGLTVLGNGVLGSEIAATAATGGAQVTLIGQARAPMLAQLGEVGAAALGTAHERAGVDLRAGAFARRLLGEDRVEAVEFHDGTVLPAADVVVAIGAAPATGWLNGSGLALDDGVVCDGAGRAASRVWAVGDIARFFHAGLGHHLRLENRTHATDMAQVVAADILGGAEPYRPVPYFWTDQFGTRVQVFGRMTGLTRTRIVEGDPDTGRFVAVGEDDGREVGVIGWGMPKQARIASLRLHEVYRPAVAMTVG